MSVPLALSPVLSAVIIGFVIMAVGFIIFVIIWWIRNVLRHRLPKPFLGDGSNVEWAAQKRAEIASSGSAYDRDLMHAALRSGFDVTDRDLEMQSRGFSIEGNGSHSEKDLFEGCDNTNAEELLHSWLLDSGHTDDDWANKILGDRGPK